MDNQQERWNWWLGGIIDGEGCITMVAGKATKLRKNKTKGDQNYKWIRYTPILTIVNRNQKVINKVIDIFKENNLPYYIWNTQFKRQSCITIRVHGIKRLLRTLRFVAPYLVGKKEVAELMIKYCEERLKLGNEPHTIESLSLAKKIRSINCITSSKSSETIRQPRFWREDIVQSYVRA